MTTNHTPKLPDSKIVAGDTVLGHVVFYRGSGYRFIPATDARKPSRRAWATPQEAVPSWARRMIARAALAKGEA
jgi:hypothetical protein